MFIPRIPRLRHGAVLLAVWVIAVPAFPVPAESFAAQVVEVAAGDIVTIARAGQRETIVLYGVDAPATNTRFGKQAKAFVEQHALGQDVRVRVVERREGVTYAELTLPDGANLSHLMLRDGLARWDSLSAPRDEGLKELERLAQNEQRGMWHHVSLDVSLSEPVRPSAGIQAEQRRIDRTWGGPGYQIVEERIEIDERGVKTLVLRGTGQKRAGYEIAAERQRLAEYEARLEQIRQEQEEQARQLAEAQQRALEEQRRLQQQRIEQMELENMQMLNRRLQQQGPNIIVTPVRPDEGGV